MAELLQTPGVLNLTMKQGDDLSFDALFNVDMTSMTYASYVVPMLTLGALDIPIVITINDIVTGNLHFYISQESIIDLPLLVGKHRWYFYWVSGGLKRTILAGYLNLEGN